VENILHYYYFVYKIIKNNEILYACILPKEQPKSSPERRDINRGSSGPKDQKPKENSIVNGGGNYQQNGRLQKFNLNI
jgi:hypothetical protein